jgi:putative transposase
VKDTLLLVSFKTYRHWLLEQRIGKQPKKVGRPRVAKELVDLVIRLAKENAGWGINRILGEIKKLGSYLGRSSIRRVLVQEGLFPNPHRRNWRLPDSPWRHFLEVHMNSIVACDFLCKEVLTPLGKKTAHLLMFIHLETRKVFVSPATFEPHEEWVCQQARNVKMWLEDAGIQQRFILHDNDTKFSDEFDEIFREENMEVVKTPFEAPDANAFAESWIGNFKRECLNHFLCFGLRHLDHIAQQGVEFYNNCRPHQSKLNEPLRFPGDKSPRRPSAKGEVTCKKVLGGLLKHYYYRTAA